MRRAVHEHRPDDRAHGHPAPSMPDPLVEVEVAGRAVRWTCGAADRRDRRRGSARGPSARHDGADGFAWKRHLDATIWLPYRSNQMVATMLEEIVGFPDRIARTVELAHPPATVWAA